MTQASNEDMAYRRRQRSGLRALALFVLSALAAGGAAGVIAADLTHSSTTKTVTAGRTTSASTVAVAEPTKTVSEIYQTARRGIVEIRATNSDSAGSQVPGPTQSETSQGTGFVIDKQGNIVTNDHVVSGATAIRVTLATGASYTAKLVGESASKDIAVLRITAPKSALYPLTFADSATVQVGDGVLAVGDPYGLTDTATMGIVSALGRIIASPNHHAITGVIQTDAAINSGNSGGPLLNAQGQVIGINSQIESQSGGNIGIGFAIASNMVKSTIVGILGSQA